MLSLQNADRSRNRILAIRCTMIILLCGALLMISTISTTKVRAQGQPPAKFRRVGRPIPNQYIVVLNDDIAGQELLQIAGALTRTHGGVVGHVYRYALKGFSVHGIGELAAIGLSQEPLVEFVEEDGEATVATTQTNPPWGLDRIDQSGDLTNFPLDQAYTYNETGSGVNAYIIDTGVRTTHQDFGGRAVFGVDCTTTDANGNCVGTDGSDCFGHGTSVASIVGGSTYGVAKGVILYNVKVIPCSGLTPNSNWAAGIDWVTADHTNTHPGPAVANQSLATVTGSPSTAIDKAVRRSVAAGVTHVVAAGNKSLDASGYSPARVTQAITVGATGNYQPDDPNANPVSDQQASFSNFGSVLDLFAPGVKIPAASPSSDTGGVVPDFGGTSAASPHVAGAVARYLQTNTTACPCNISDIMTSLANPVVGNPGQNTTNKLLFTPLSWPSPTYYSLSLNGTSGYVDVPNTPAGLGVQIDITSAITVEAWINTTSLARQGVVERYNNAACTGTADGGYALIIRANGNVRFQTLKNGCEFDTLDAVATVRDGAWHHVAGVFDGSEMRIYVDGQRVAFKPSTFYPGTGISHLLIGRSQDGAGYFSGFIDEVRVTARAVYAGASFSISGLNHLTGTQETKGLWRFDRQNVKDCADINNGTTFGSTSFSTTVP